MKLPFLVLLPALAASVLLPGCAGWIPQIADHPISGREIRNRDVAFIVPGKTTRKEVIQNLGNRYTKSPRVPAVAYSWEQSTGTAFLLNPMDSQTRTHKLSRWRALFLDFDSRDVVTRKQIVRLNKDQTLVPQLEEWAGAKPSQNPAEGQVSGEPPLF